MPRAALVVLLALSAACTRLPPMEQTSVRAKSVAELRDYLRTHQPDVELFRPRGPFAVSERKDVEVRVSPREAYAADLYAPSAAGKAPLVILLHGYDSSKEAHANQAMHMASWGMHVLAVQLPKRGPWVTNGRILGRIVGAIRRAPDAIDNGIDVNRIVLAGHSFGGAAVAIAMGEGAPAVGGVLLDPAAVGRDLPKLLQQISRPVMILGADEELGSTRNREYFYRYVRSGVSEVSIRDATHEDAQYPSEYSLRNYGSDPYTTEEVQMTFTAALTAAAWSLASTGGLDYAWSSFEPVLRTGKLFNPRRK